MSMSIASTRDEMEDTCQSNSGRMSNLQVVCDSSPDRHVCLSVCLSELQLYWEVPSPPNLLPQKRSFLQLLELKHLIKELFTS